jgi:hypothetical protein
MEFYSVIKKNEIMLFAGKWMELEFITLTKNTYPRQVYMFSLICGSLGKTKQNKTKS